MSREATRLRILDAAVRLLEDPHKTVSLDAVAARADVSRQTLYAHFDSRANLLVEVVEHVKASLGFDGLVAPVLSATTAPEALEALMQMHQAFTPTVLAAALAVDAERHRDRDIAEALESRPIGRHQLALHVATRLAAEGRLGHGLTAEIAADLIGVLSAPAATEELLHRRGWTVDDLAPRLLALFRTRLLDD